MVRLAIVGIIYCCLSVVPGQFHQLPQDNIRKLKGEFSFKNATIVSWDDLGVGAAMYFKEQLPNEKILAKKGLNGADIFLATDTASQLGEGGFVIEVLANQVIVTASTETGFKNVLQRLIQLCSESSQSQAWKLGK